MNNPHSILEYITKKEWKNSTKHSYSVAYANYCRYNNIEYKAPYFRRDSQPPYVPTSEEITTLCSDAGKKYSLILNTLRDTGMRPIELHRMTPNWIDLNKGIIRVATAKGGQGRSLKLKENTLAMLKEYLIVNKSNPRKKIFSHPKIMGDVFRKTRQRTAKKLQRPELLKITLYSFRHYFASKLYQQTREYLVVMRALGHKRIQQTITYIHMITDGFDDNDFTTATAETVKDARRLIEDGYSKVDEFNGIHIYKKRK